MRAWLGLAALAAVVAALGTWLYVRPPAGDAHTYAVSTLSQGDVRQLRVERFGTVALEVALERSDGTWRMTMPATARASAFQVGRLIAIVEARSAVRYPATDLARYGLDKPAARLTINDETFEFGMVNTTTREQYVRVGGYVYLVPLNAGAALPRDADALLARELFGEHERLVRIELPGVSAFLTDGRWHVEPAGGETSADERAAWVDLWQQAIATRAERHTGAAAPESLYVTFREGPTITIGILRREPELVLVRSDEGVAYWFAAAAGKRLLAPPAAAPEPPAR